MKKDQFLYLSDKLDVVDDRLDGVEKILALQEQNLAEHMKRTDLLERQVTPLNKFMWAALGIVAFLAFTEAGPKLLNILSN
jgi:hypothetical protein